MGNGVGMERHQSNHPNWRLHRPYVSCPEFNTQADPYAPFPPEWKGAFNNIR